MCLESMVNKRWDWLVSETETALRIMRVEEVTEITEEDVKLIVSVLKGNVPFLVEELPFINGEED